jgi:DNA-binding MarR family transcriptional regulator
VRKAEQIRYLILAVQREGSRQLSAILSHIGLTPAQSEALVVIGNHGPLSLKDLGDMLVCDSGTSPSRIVDRLVEAGLVNRAAGEHDRRQIQLTVTAPGLKKADQVRLIEERLYGGIDRALNADDTDALLRGLRSLLTDSPARATFERRLAADGSHPESDHPLQPSPGTVA